MGAKADITFNQRSLPIFLWMWQFQVHDSTLSPLREKSCWLTWPHVSWRQHFVSSFSPFSNSFFKFWLFRCCWITLKKTATAPRLIYKPNHIALILFFTRGEPQEPSGNWERMNTSPCEFLLAHSNHPVPLPRWDNWEDNKQTGPGSQNFKENLSTILIVSGHMF